MGVKNCVQDLFLASIKKSQSTDKAESEKMKVAGKTIYYAATATSEHLAAIVDRSSFGVRIIVIIAIEVPRFFHPKLALTQKCDYSLLKEEKSVVSAYAPAMPLRSSTPL